MLKHQEVTKLQQYLIFLTYALVSKHCNWVVLDGSNCIFVKPTSVVTTYQKFRLISQLSSDLQTHNPCSAFSGTVLNVRSIWKKRKKSNFNILQMVAKLLVRLPQIIYHTKPHDYSYNPCKTIWSSWTGSGNKGVINIDTNYGTQCSSGYKYHIN
jgi:hypothetical protein